MVAVAALNVLNVPKATLIEGVGLSKEDVDALFKYRKKVPCIAEEHPEVEGFVVDAHQMWKQLGLDMEAQAFRNWARHNLKDPVYKVPKKKQKSLKGLSGEKSPKVFEEGVDYETYFIPSEGGRPSKGYRLTIETAKQLAMAGTGAHCHAVRKYFIVMEKAFYKLLAWQDKRLQSCKGDKQIAAYLWDNRTDEEALREKKLLSRMISDKIVAKHGKGALEFTKKRTVQRDSVDQLVNEDIAEMEASVSTLLRAGLPTLAVMEAFENIYRL